MEITIDTMGLSDLQHLKSILKERLEEKVESMNRMRGYNYDLFRQREISFLQDPDHEKLKRVNRKIDDIINVIQ